MFGLTKIPSIVKSKCHLVPRGGCEAALFSTGIPAVVRLARTQIHMATKDGFPLLRLLHRGATIVTASDDVGDQE